MRFGWFDATEARHFGTRLAESLSDDFSTSEQRRRKIAVARRAQLVQKLFAQVRLFNQTHKLNIYKKAQLGNAFKWKLLELGFEAEFVDELTKELMLRIADGSTTR